MREKTSDIKSPANEYELKEELRIQQKSGKHTIKNFLNSVVFWHIIPMGVGPRTCNNERS